MTKRPKYFREVAVTMAGSCAALGLIYAFGSEGGLAHKINAAAHIRHLGDCVWAYRDGNLKKSVETTDPCFEP